MADEKPKTLQEQSSPTGPPVSQEVKDMAPAVTQPGKEKDKAPDAKSVEVKETEAAGSKKLDDIVKEVKEAQQKQTDASCYIMYLNFPAVYKNTSGVFGINSAKNLHKGRFSGTVLSQKSMDLAFLNRQIHIQQHLVAGKTFCYVFHFQNRTHHWHPALFMLYNKGRLARSAPKNTPGPHCTVTFPPVQHQRPPPHLLPV